MVNSKTEDQWKQVVTDCRNSGLSVRKWCEDNHIKPSTYRYWFTKLRKQENIASDTRWAEMVIPPMETSLQPKASVITIRYESFAIDISETTDTQLLAEVLRTLRAVC